MTSNTPVTDKKLDYVYIDSEKGLTQLNQILNKAPQIAIDTEADSLHNYYEKVCLIQLTINQKNYIIDPLTNIHFGTFFEILSSKHLILHAADYDLRMLKQSFNFVHKSTIFDTMLASKLLGFKQLGLAALVEKFFGQTLSKQSQRANWSRRPLTENLLQYACRDTYYLEKIQEKLNKELTQLKRTAWQQEYCQRTITNALVDAPTDHDKEWRIKGAGLLNPSQLNIVREVWYWREEEAKAINQPPFKILSNSHIITMAKSMAKSDNGAIQYPHFVKGTRLNSLSKTIKKALKVPSSKWPQKPKKTKPAKDTSSNKIMIDKTKEECQKLANQLNIESHTIASRAVIEAVINNHAKTIDEMMSCSPIMKWQAELIEPIIQKVL